LFDVESQIFVTVATTNKSRAHFRDTIKLPAFEKPLFGGRFSTMCLTQTEL